MDYSTLTKAELQTEIDRRNEGRPPVSHIARTGTNPELIERLQADDAETSPVEDEAVEDEDLLADDGADEDMVAAQSFDAGEADDPDPNETSDTSNGLVTPRLFEARYEMHGQELGTALHQEFLTRVSQDAAAAGHSVKGGPYRERFDTEGGKHYAVYRVNVRG